MIRVSPIRRWLRASALRRDDRASQLVEFAVSLPLLVVFVVGIFDFSGAFTLKQKLTNIARDAARAAASEPIVDVTNPGSDSLSSSVDDAVQMIQQYLTANNLSTCGTLSPFHGPMATSPGNWTFTASSASPPCSLTIIINRGYYFPASGTPQTAPSDCQPAAQGSPSGLQAVATCVSVQYAYQWRFGQVAGLLGPSTALPTPLIATAVAMNED